MAIFYELFASIFSPHFIARSYRKLDDLSAIKVAGKKQANYEAGIYAISVSDHSPYVTPTNTSSLFSNACNTFCYSQKIGHHVLRL
jgi:hypothetical protein